MFPDLIPENVSFWSNMGQWFSELFNSLSTKVEFWTTFGLVALTMAIMVGLPKLTKKLPEALIGILVVSAIVIFGKLDVATVGSFIHEGGGSNDRIRIKQDHIGPNKCISGYCVHNSTSDGLMHLYLPI